jgi:hypothetical protein
MFADLIPPGGGRQRPNPPRYIPPPAPVAAESAPMRVRVDLQATRSVLTIPQKLLPNSQLGFAEPAPSSGIGIGRSAIAGLVMSIAVAGTFLVLRTRRSRAVLMLLVCGTAMIVAAKLWADIPPPGPVPPPKTDVNRASPLTFALRAAAEGNVIIKISQEGDAVTLVLAGKGHSHAGGAESTAPAPTAPAAPPAPNE